MRIKKIYIIILTAFFIFLLLLNNSVYAAGNSNGGGRRVGEDPRYYKDETNDLLYSFVPNDSDGDDTRVKTGGKLYCTINKAGITVSYIYDENTLTFVCPNKSYVTKYGLKEKITLSEAQGWSKKNPDKDRVYFKLEDVVKNADTFLNWGAGEQNISEGTMKTMSESIYNVLFILGVVLAFIVGGILAIRFITSGLEGKAEVKQLMIPYIIGLVIIFGAFTIWKIVLTILQD